MAGPRELRWISAVCSSQLQSRERIALFGLIAALGGLAGQASTPEISKASGVCVRQLTEAMRVLTALGVVARTRKARDVAEYAVDLGRLCSADSADHETDDDLRIPPIMAPDVLRNPPNMTCDETRNPPIIEAHEARNPPIMDQHDQRIPPIIASNRNTGTQRAPAHARAVNNSDPGIELQEREGEQELSRGEIFLSPASSNVVDPPSRSSQPPPNPPRRVATLAQRRAAEHIANGQLLSPESESPFSRVCRAFEAIRTGSGMALNSLEVEGLRKALADSNEATLMAAIAEVAVACQYKTVKAVIVAVERLKNHQQQANATSGRRALASVNAPWAAKLEAAAAAKAQREAEGAPHPLADDPITF